MKVEDMPKEVKDFWESQERYSTDEKRCQEFDHGIFNLIAIGYAQMAMRDIGYSDEKVIELGHVMYSIFDFVGASEALDFYRKH